MSDLRASDAEREAVAEALRAHHLEGRLTDEELQERIDRCLSARTRAELDALTADLPGEPSPPPGRRPRGLGRRRLPVLLALLLLVSFVVPHHGHHHFPWGLLLVGFFIFRFFVLRRMPWDWRSMRGGWRRV